MDERQTKPIRRLISIQDIDDAEVERCPGGECWGLKSVGLQIPSACSSLCFRKRRNSHFSFTRDGTSRNYDAFESVQIPFLLVPI